MTTVTVTVYFSSSLHKHKVCFTKLLNSNRNYNALEVFTSLQQMLGGHLTLWPDILSVWRGLTAKTCSSENYVRSSFCVVKRFFSCLQAISLLWMSASSSSCNLGRQNGKEYLNALTCKFYTFSRQNSETFDISYAFLSLTFALLSTLKNSPVSRPTLYFCLMAVCYR